METIECKICNSKKNKFLFLKEGFKIIRCKKCKIVFVYPFLTLEESTLIYDNGGYYSEIIAHDERKSNSEKFPWKKILINVEKLIKNKGKLLDIGSGTGFFLDLARQGNWQVYGIEPSKFAYNYSIQKYNLNILNKSLKESNFPEGFFDAVTLWNTLEHLVDPLDMLFDVRKILKVHGLMALSVPNIDSFEASIFRENWAELQPLKKGHLYYFTPYTIKYILNKTGFKIEKIFSLGGFGFRSHIFKQDVNIANNRKSVLVEWMASVIRFILDIFKKGGILIVVARKLDKYNQ